MNRFLTFFLVSFIIHLAVGALLLSRTGILGGGKAEETQLSDIENNLLEQEEKKPIPSPSFEKPSLKKKKKNTQKLNFPKKPVRKKKLDKTPQIKKTKKPVITPKPPSPPETPKSPVKEKQLETKIPPVKTDIKEEWVDEEEIEAEKTEAEKTEAEETKAEKKPPETTNEKPNEKPNEMPNKTPSDKTSDKTSVEKKPLSPAGDLSSSGKKKILENSRSHSQLRQLTGNPIPVYPKEARKKRWEGTVEVSYYVNSGGFVEKIQLKKSSGHSVLDNAALRALARYRYSPGQEGWVKHPVEFSLETDKEILETAPLGKP